ncbi:MAG TPA: carbohydrate ABC transporter permease [Geminicoccaceae bacterium]|nr:carbohydrate ABC transporter permease [Geminicoccus sp.]HMU48154.1 carbohydrate ABC transporter permease [Geminicoccaceae bacterium]
MSSAALPRLAAVATDWQAVAARSRRSRRLTTTLLYAFLVLGSMPILIPYLWLVTVAFSGRTGASTLVLWRTLGVVLPALLLWSILRLSLEEGRRLRQMEIGLGLVTLALVAVLTGPYLHVDNWRFLWNPNIADTLKGASGVGAKFPNVWVAFGNSLTLALLQMTLVLVVSTLAGYYLSRYEFPGRANYLRGLLVLHAFPAMTLIIPIFLLMHWIGLLDTLTGVILVIAALELPFAIFVMKGFFDAVPWDIEMSAMTDGASRRQAFLLVVLPQVKVGMIAVGIFAFLRGWEEYVFVRTLLLAKSNWTMSLYLFWMREDVMGTDYAMVSAMGVFYVLPSVLLYTFTQKYLTQMTIGGIKG